MPKIENILRNLARRNERDMQVAIQEWMDFVQKQIKQDLRSKYEKSVTSKLTDWKRIESQGVSTIKPAAIKIMQTGGNAAYRHLAIEGSFDVLNVSAVKAVNKFCSKLVTEVTNNTKKGINTYVKHGIKEGHSMSRIARDLRPLVGLTQKQTQAVINYRKMLTVTKPHWTPTQIDKAVMRYTNKTHRRRMQTIARTETARAQNIGYVQGLEEVGIEEVEFSVAADCCVSQCLPLDGKKYKANEAAGIIPVHPNCRCAMLPVINDRVISEQLKKPHPRLKVGV